MILWSLLPSLTSYLPFLGTICHPVFYYFHAPIYPSFLVSCFFLSLLLPVLCSLFFVPILFLTQPFLTPVSSFPFRLFHSSCLDYIHSFMVPQLVLMPQFYLLTLVVKHTDKTVSYVQRVYFSSLSDKDKGGRGSSLMFWHEFKNGGGVLFNCPAKPPIVLCASRLLPHSCAPGADSVAVSRVPICHVCFLKGRNAESTRVNTCCYPVLFSCFTLPQPVSALISPQVRRRSHPAT